MHIHAVMGALALWARAAAHSAAASASSSPSDSSFEFLTRLSNGPNASGSLGATAREEVPFDFGFRFHLGDPDPTKCTATSELYKVNISGVQCTGLYGVHTATTPEECAAAACAARATAWQVCPGGKCTAPCFIGGVPYAKQCTRADARFAGFARAFDTWPIDTAPATSGYSDASWEVVDAPHDALIGTPYRLSADNGEASIPRNVSWYRKHFVLPAEWKGSHVSVYVDGAYALTTAWLNGVRFIVVMC
jgi:hypothetical protein